MIKKAKLTLLISLYTCNAYSAEELMNVQAMYDKASKHVLKIDTKETYSAHGSEQNGTGSGFWLGGESRLIITNAHIASAQQVAKYEAVDLDGNRFPLKLVYSNPIIDLAYLRPENDNLHQPESTFDFCLEPEKNSNVYMIGNNGGNGIVQQDGKISDILSIEITDYPRKSIIVSINGKGGSSGSMVIDQYGRIIGVNYATSDISSCVIPVEFLIEDLNYLNKRILPPKMDIGITFQHISADEAQKYFHFILPSPTDYNNKFKGARSRLLQVTRCLRGTIADQHLEPGDIITMIENEPIGPDLFKYHSLLNSHNQGSVKVTYFRNSNEEKVVDLPLHNINETIRPEMIIFGKAIFTYVDLPCAFLSGLPVGAVALLQNPLGNIFYDHMGSMPFHTREVAAFLIRKIDNSFINDLDDMERIIPEITKKRYFSFVFEDHAGSYQRPGNAYTQYDVEDHQTPIRLSYDWATQKWTKKEIKAL